MGCLAHACMHVRTCAPMPARELAVGARGMWLLHCGTEQWGVWH